MTSRILSRHDGTPVPFEAGMRIFFKFHKTGGKDAVETIRLEVAHPQFGNLFFRTPEGGSSELLLYSGRPLGLPARSSMIGGFLSLITVTTGLVTETFRHSNTQEVYTLITPLDCN